MTTRIKLGSLFLNNSTGYGVAGGAATGEATTPWVVLNTDWTPVAAVPVSVWSGGPPFTPGRRLAYQSYDDVTERVPLMLDATSHDDAANEVQVLRQLIGQVTAVAPLILEIKPSGSTNSMYAEVKAASLQETPDLLIAPVAGALRLHVALTWVRTPFFGTISSGETLLNAVAYTNTGTGTPDNIAAYSAGSGDLIAQGQPLNIQFDPPTNEVVAGLYLASVASAIYDATGAGAKSSSSSLQMASISVDCSALMANVGLKCRVLIRIDAVSANARLRVIITSATNGPIFASNRYPYVDPPGLNNDLVDMGSFDLSWLRRARGMTAPSLLFQPYLYSSDGANATCTYSYVEILFYYDFCVVDLTDPQNGGVHTFGANEVALIDAFAEQTNYPCLPHPSPQALILDTSSADPIIVGAIRGAAPSYYTGASLWAAWWSGTEIGRSHDMTDTAAFTATHAPLWLTFRGAD